MEKLTLKEIAGYLPYQLKGEFKLSQVAGVDLEKDEIRKKLLTADNCQFFLNYCKPYLFPLEMLTKTIVHNGVEIIPIDEINDLIGDLDVCISLWNNKELSIEVVQPGCEYTSERDENTVDISLSQIMEITSFLHELHFDLYGLIERGLAVSKAIDKSTLNSK